MLTNGFGGKIFLFSFPRERPGRLLELIARRFDGLRLPTRVRIHTVLARYSMPYRHIDRYLQSSTVPSQNNHSSLKVVCEWRIQSIRSPSATSITNSMLCDGRRDACWALCWRCSGGPPTPISLPCLVFLFLFPAISLVRSGLVLVNVPAWPSLFRFPFLLLLLLLLSSLSSLPFSPHHRSRFRLRTFPPVSTDFYRLSLLDGLFSPDSLLEFLSRRSPFLPKKYQHSNSPLTPSNNTNTECPPRFQFPFHKRKRADKPVPVFRDFYQKNAL